MENKFYKIQMKSFFPVVRSNRLSNMFEAILLEQFGQFPFDSAHHGEALVDKCCVDLHTRSAGTNLLVGIRSVADTAAA